MSEQQQSESLDDLLSEFDEQVQPEVQSPQPVVEDQSEMNALRAEIAELKAFRDASEQQQSRNSLNETVNQMQGLNDTLKDVNPNLIEGFLQVKASQDPRIAQAWMHRHVNPEGFNKVLKGLSDDLAGNFRPVDKAVTDDLAALKSAVTEAPAEPPTVTNADLNSMSDAEFAAYKQKLSA